MLRHRRHLSFLIVSILTLNSFAPAQKHPAEAEENPLSTVLYLLSTTDKDDEEGEKACLAKSLASVDRFEEVHRAIDMVERESYVEDQFVPIIHELIRRGREKEASTLVTHLLKRVSESDYRLEMLVRPMILLKRDEELEALIEKFDDSDQDDLWIKTSEAYGEVGKPEKALAALEKTVKAAMASEFAERRAELAMNYAKLGREAEAMQLVQSVLRELDPKSINIDLIHDLSAAYRSLGKYSEANELRRHYDGGLNIDETRDLVSIASRLITKGDRQKALDTLAQALAQLDPKKYGDSFNLGNIIELYLQIGEIQKAEQVAMSITGSDYMQQRQLLAVSDRYAKAANKTKAREILRFALAQTYKIDISEAESGSLWTSGKWDQARHQSQIAIRYMDLRDDKEALRITARLKKPYLRALVLTEYVAINKNRISAKKLAPYLEEAILLLRRKQIDVFDSKKFDVYAIAARNFAEIGMAKRANEVFAEALTKLDQEMIEERSEAGLLYSMCNIGVDFERAKIKVDENVRTALRKIITHWESDEY